MYCLVNIALLFLCLLLPAITTATERIPDQPRFKRLSAAAEQNISSILSIHKDRFGFMWFGGKDGLARFDGYEFSIYRTQPDNPDSLSNNVIWDIAEAPNGDLWLATEKGLNQFIRDTQVFVKHPSPSSWTDAKRRDRILTLFRDKHTLLLGSDGGLSAFDLNTQTFTSYPRHNQEQGLAGEYVLSLIHI